MIEWYGTEYSFEQLIGLHELSGVDKDYIPADGTSYGHYAAMKFCLDGNTYRAEEDPDDGYRSVIGKFEQVSEKCRNTFPPQKVFCIVNRSKSEKGILTMYDVTTGEIVLSVGTDYTDAYYPFCVMDFCPWNMKINKDKKNYMPHKTFYTGGLVVK